MKIKLFLLFALLALHLSAFEVTIANTGSMGSALKSYSRHEVCMAYQFKDLKPGMIAVYYNPLVRLGSAMISHRCHHYQKKNWLHAEGWVMKGDANDRFDPGLMTAKNYIGVILN